MCKTKHKYWLTCDKAQGMKHRLLIIALADHEHHHVLHDFWAMQLWFDDFFCSNSVEVFSPDLTDPILDSISVENEVWSDRHLPSTNWWCTSHPAIRILSCHCCLASVVPTTHLFRILVFYRHFKALVSITEAANGSCSCRCVRYTSTSLHEITTLHKLTILSLP